MAITHPTRLFMPKIILLTALLFSSGVALAARINAANSSTCRPLDDNAIAIRSYLRELVTTTDAERVGLRGDLGLVAMDSSKVVLVTTARTCDNVGTGMNTAFKTVGAARNLYVFSVGQSYVAQDPDRPAGEWRPLVALNSKFVVGNSVLAQ
jgi:hypothetical protein